MNHRIEELLGPFDAWVYCPHGPSEHCACRKPLPKMIFDAAALMRVDASRCVVIGDKPSDEQAARSAGATAILIGDAREAAIAVDRLLLEAG